MRKPVLFISYAHADEPEKPREGETQWLSFVIGFLRSAFPDDAATIWTDRLMPGGADWNAEIQRQLRECDVFVLLVSRHSLASEFVVKKEIAAIRARQKAGERVHFYPLLLTPTPKAALKIVADKNVRPRGGKPLSSFPSHEREHQMSEAADEIEEIVSKLAAKALEPPLRTPKESKRLQFEDRETLEVWLRKQGRDVAVAIAARAALRVAPLLVRSLPRQPGAISRQQVAGMATSVFRAAGLARVAAKYPTRADVWAAAAAASAAVNRTAAPYAAYTYAAPAAYAASAAAADADADAASAAASAAAASAATAAPASASASAAIWQAISTDAAIVSRQDPSTLADAPLWTASAPDWVSAHWADMQVMFPTGEDWDVWKSWYDERLRGIARGEAWDMAFVDWPDEVWKQGPQVVNARIRDRLAALAARAPPGLPGAVPDIASPSSFVWTDKGQVAAIPGAESFPLYADYTNPDDHHAALAAAREAAKQALICLPKDARNFDLNAYAPVLRAYTRQLPKAAGVGNILLANESDYRLRRMYDLDRAALPSSVLAALESLFRCHGKVAAFYDIVRRFEAAIPGEPWEQPFPEYAVGQSRQTMRAYTPKFIEPAVGRGLTRVAKTAPAGAPPPGAAESDATPPPRGLPEVPDELQAYQMLIAGALNAFWATFRDGQARPPDRAQLEQAKRDLAAAVTPLLRWLESVKEQKKP